MENEVRIRFAPAGEYYGGLETGLAMLGELLGLVEDGELANLVSRLETGIHDENLFGSCSDSRESINRIIFQLNLVLWRLTGNREVSFVDLCKGAKPELV